MCEKNDGVYRAVECPDTTEDVLKRLGALNSPQFGVKNVKFGARTPKLDTDRWKEEGCFQSTFEINNSIS